MSSGCVEPGRKCGVVSTIGVCPCLPRDVWPLVTPLVNLLFFCRYNFQQVDTIVQPGSLDAEAGIYAMGFDGTGSRLVTCEADKTVKIWAEDASADEESHPVDMRAWTKACRQYKRY